MVGDWDELCPSQEAEALQEIVPQQAPPLPHTDASSALAVLQLPSSTGFVVDRGNRMPVGLNVVDGVAAMGGDTGLDEGVLTSYLCGHYSGHMKVVTVRDFRDRASEMFRSDDVILVTREGRPAGFFLPWTESRLSDDVRRELFLRLSDEIAAQRKRRDVSEQGVLDDFAAARGRR